MKEEKAWEEIKKYSWFKSDDLKKVINSERMTYIFLKKWIEEGKIAKLPFYIYSPIDHKTGKYKADIFEVACQVSNQAYLCVVTAAKIHGLKVPESNTIYIGSYQQFAPKNFDGWILKYKRAIDIEYIVKKGILRYTGYTFTVIDICKDFQKYMDIESFIEFLRSIDELKADKIVSCLNFFNNKILNSKIGWLVDEGFLKVDRPDIVLKYCIDKGDNIRRLLYANMECISIYNEKWRLDVPRCLYEPF